jgi:dolichyl-phosphate beta-glucosyltransferase
VALILIANFVLRVLPSVRQSKSFTNTHDGEFVDLTSASPLPIVGKSVTSQKSSSSSREGEVLQSAGTLDLTVVVPAYNEQDRIGAMLEETISFLEDQVKVKPNFTYEIVVVNDGSKDNTKEKVLEYTKQHGFAKVRLLNLRVNCGKGAAINKGMRYSRGKTILFADADGATKFSDCTSLEKELKRITKDELGCVVGSRYTEAAEAERTALRRFVSFVFHLPVILVCGAEIKDTQCGFKMFTRKAAQLIFQSQHVDRWAFDVEVLFLCKYFTIPVAEVPVTWNEVGGSKMTIGGVIGMIRDILLIRFLYILGVWTTKSKRN